MSRIGAAPRAAVPTPGAPTCAAAPKSHARAEASRKNGARSRGPKTPEGKARSSRNALKHGMRAEKYLVLPDEDAAEFADLEAALVAELAPAGTLQTMLVRRIIVAAWRLARADRIEAELFAERHVPDGGLGLALIRDGNGTRSFETLLRYRGAAMAEFWRALRTLKALQAEQSKPVESAVGVPALARGSGAAARVPIARRPNEPEPHGTSCEMVRRDTASERERPRTLQEPAARWTPNEPEPPRIVHEAAPTWTPDPPDTHATNETEPRSGPAGLADGPCPMNPSRGGSGPSQTHACVTHTRASDLPGST